MTWRSVVPTVRGVGVLILLGACSGPLPPRPQLEDAQPARDLIAEVRQAGTSGEDGIEVRPLRDPLVLDLVEAATGHERRREWRDADLRLQEALVLVPGDPGLLQWRAELALVLGELDAAVRLANASWEAGPRLGSLCRRNWAAIRLARELSALPDSADRAAAQGDKCTVAPPVRM